MPPLVVAPDGPAADEPPTPADPARWRARGKVLMVMRLIGGRAGGAERLFCDISNMLADAGYDVTVVSCDSSDKPPPYPYSPRISRINLWSTAARNAPWYRLLDGMAAGYKKLPLLAPADWLSKNLYFIRRLHVVARDLQPDAIVSFMPPANTPSLIAGWLAGAKVVPTNHNVPRHDYTSDVRWDQNPIDKWLRLQSLRAATRIHVLFPTFAEWFPAHLRDRIVPIPNAVSPAFLQPSPERPRRKEIVAVGRLTDVKNYTVLVDAWAKIAARHPDWSVKIFGTGPDKKAIEARIRAGGVAGSCHLMGHNHDIKATYLESEILAHPAQFEGFGLSVAEALCCGVPVVAFSDCAGVNEFVHDGENGLMVDRAGGADAFAAGLERLIADEPLRKRLRAAGPASLNAYTPEIFRERWVRIIEDVIAEGRRR